MFTNENCMMMLLGALILILCVKTGLIGGHPHESAFHNSLSWYGEKAARPSGRGSRRGSRRGRRGSRRFLRMRNAQGVHRFNPNMRQYTQDNNFTGMHGGHEVRKCKTNADCDGYLGVRRSPGGRGYKIPRNVGPAARAFCSWRKEANMDMGLKNQQKQAPGTQHYCRIAKWTDRGEEELDLTKPIPEKFLAINSKKADWEPGP